MSNAELSENGSLTPPLADIEEQWQEFGITVDTIIVDTELSPKRQKTEEFYREKFTPFFKCCHTNKTGERHKSKLRGGYIEPRLLSRLLHNEETKDNLFEKQVIKLFDYEVITQTALIEQRQKLFNFLRQKIFEFESQETDQSLSSYISQKGENYQFYTNIREQCCSFLLYVSGFVHRNLSTFAGNFAETNDPYLKSWNSFPASLRKDLNNLWHFVGPVSNLPNGSFLKLDGVNIKLSPTAQRLHLHLELKWGLIEILWRMYYVKDEKCVDQLAELEEKISSLIRDLVYIATHINKGSIPSAVLHTPPFLCACIKELWVIMIHFLDFSSANEDMKSFWSALTTILNELLPQGDKDQVKNFSFKVSEINCKDPILFCWWILVHIAPLYWYNVEGEYVFKEKVIITCIMYSTNCPLCESIVSIENSLANQ